MDIKLIKIHTITATLVLESGLHIGAGKDTIQIGGVDNPVIKNPLTHEPYIPGSSVKGKLRSLLEWLTGRVETEGKSAGAVWGSDSSQKMSGKYKTDDPILRTFGTTLKEWKAGPTRLIVRDASLDPAWAKSIRDRELPLTEEKTEVSIDRIQGKAANMGPRRTERVPAGAKFRLEMSFKQFETDGDGGSTDLHCLNWVLIGLKLLERDALGGSGSRGYGRIRVADLQWDGRSLQDAFDAVAEIDHNTPPQLVEAG